MLGSVFLFLTFLDLNLGFENVLAHVVSSVSLSTLGNSNVSGRLITDGLICVEIDAVFFLSLSSVCVPIF